MNRTADGGNIYVDLPVLNKGISKVDEGDSDESLLLEAEEEEAGRRRRPLELQQPVPAPRKRQRVTDSERRSPLNDPNV